jgi:hypothetical protein
MKKVIYSIVSILLVSATGAFLFVLSDGNSERFLGSIRAMGNEVPAITSLLLSNIEYWWAILLFVSLVSLAPIFLGRHKLSMSLSSIGFIAIVFSAYAHAFYSA